MEPASHAAELSSLASALDELIRRVVALGEDYERAKQEDIAADLYAVEGLLGMGRRRMEKAIAASS